MKRGAVRSDGSTYKNGIPRFPFAIRATKDMADLTADQVVAALHHEETLGKQCPGILGISHCFICATQEVTGHCSKCGIGICDHGCLTKDWKARGIHQQLCGAMRQIAGRPGEKRPRKKSRDSDEEAEEEAAERRRLQTVPQRRRVFRKRRTRYPVNLMALTRARYVESVGEVRIYLVTFTQETRGMTAVEGHPLGVAVQRRLSRVYLFWNTSEASADDADRRLKRLRRAILNHPQQFRPRMRQDTPKTYGRTPFGLPPVPEEQEEDPELYEWSTQMLERMHVNPKFRKEMAYSMPFVSIIHRSSMDEAFNEYLGSHNDFWFHALARLMRADGKAIQYTLHQLMRQELSADLDTVLSQGYFDKGDYRSMFFSAYLSVYLTEESTTGEVVTAAVQEFALSGGPAPWDPNEILPAYRRHETRKLRMAPTAPAGMIHGSEPIDVWTVLRRHRDYVESVWYDMSQNTPEFWGYDEHDGTMRYSENVDDNIDYVLAQLARDGVLDPTEWRGMGGIVTRRYLVNSMAPIAAVKRFPPQTNGSVGKQ